MWAGAQAASGARAQGQPGCRLTQSNQGTHLRSEQPFVTHSPSLVAAFWPKHTRFSVTFTRAFTTTPNFSKSPNHRLFCHSISFERQVTFQCPQGLFCNYFEFFSSTIACTGARLRVRHKNQRCPLWSGAAYHPPLRRFAHVGATEPLAHSP